MTSTLGLVRSLFIYRWRFWTRRRKRALYARFVSAGSVAFDIGAHVGDRTDALLSLGARVVAVEPQRELADRLAHRYHRQDRVTVIHAAVGERPGTTVLHTVRDNPTLATTSEEWVEMAGRTAGFDRFTFSGTEEVEVVTLDGLIKRHGKPAFAKIDVEGSEDAVLRGVSVALPAISFEVLPQNRAVGIRAVEALVRLGSYRFAFSPGETMQLPADANWISGVQIVETIANMPSNASTGDIYARLSE